MNMLILGVLFLVALLAIGGAVWLAVGERQRNGKAATTITATPDQQIPASTNGDQEATAGRALIAPAPVAVDSDELVHPIPDAQVARREQPFAALNGQFYELAAELRALHSDAQDIEQRLGVLTDMVNRIEQEYGEVGLEAR